MRVSSFLLNGDLTRNDIEPDRNDQKMTVKYINIQNLIRNIKQDIGIFSLIKSIENILLSLTILGI